MKRNNYNHKQKLRIMELLNPITLTQALEQGYKLSSYSVHTNPVEMILQESPGMRYTIARVTLPVDQVEAPEQPEFGDGKYILTHDFILNQDRLVWVQAWKWSWVSQEYLDSPVDQQAIIHNQASDNYWEQRLSDTRGW